MFNDKKYFHISKNYAKMTPDPLSPRFKESNLINKVVPFCALLGPRNHNAQIDESDWQNIY